MSLLDYSLLIFLLTQSLLISACYPVQNTNASSLPSFINQDNQSSEDMVRFEGIVFVAASELAENLWEAAGWQISDQPIDTDAQELPLDCTLYPHAGVVGQWVGSCAGMILVPRQGAEHIAVMVTSRDGLITMVQVAPEPVK